MTCFAVFFWAFVRDIGGGTVPFSPVLRAYWASQLGKYAPGKAWVVAIRCDMLGERAGTYVAAVGSAYETLFAIAMGALVAVPVLAVPGQDIPRVWLAAASCLMVCLAGASAPPVFRRLTRLVAKPLRHHGAAELPVCRARTLALGVVLACGGWAFLGTSAWAIARGAGAEGLTWAEWPIVVGATAWGVVWGFVAFIIPGGLGVREAAMAAALAPVLGEANAAVVAVGARLIWVLTEVFITLGSLLWVRARKGRMGDGGSSPPSSPS
jgi:hypothetical protein